jgi:RNA polymerase subunit RPABC4/transcription elongation factor Spt4
MDLDFDCDGGFGWILPAFIVGKLISEAFDRPHGTWPHPPQPTPSRAPSPEPSQNAAGVSPQAARRCQHCDYAVSASYTYCPHCGKKLAPAACRYCNQTLRPEMAYCPHCGGPSR